LDKQILNNKKLDCYKGIS